MRGPSRVVPLLGAALVLGALVGGVAYGQGRPVQVDRHAPPGGPVASRALGPVGSAVPDPCLDCSAIYAGDCSRGLWRIDPTTGTSTIVGTMPTNMFDVAISSDGRLFGLAGNGDIYEISACDGSGVVVRSGPPLGNGMTGDISTTDLFSQGPPLFRIATGTPSVTVVGGAAGPAPPFWCGPSSGDLALNPADGLLYSSVVAFGGCGGCGGDVLITIDPATGDVQSEVGCIQEAGGRAFITVYGLAFDANGDLWGAIGLDGPFLIRIDPATAIATVVPITGGYLCAFGIATCPMQSTPPAVCPSSQGYWKNHPGDWPVDSLALGVVSYTKAEAIALLRTPVRGDASVILAKQLIAAKLNIESGSDPTPVAAEVAAADILLGGLAGRLPYGVRPSTAEGHDMTATAAILDDYNNKLLTPNCEERRVMQLQTPGGCAGSIGAPMPPRKVLGALLPFLAVFLVLIGLRVRRRAGRLATTP